MKKRVVKQPFGWEEKKHFLTLLIALWIWLGRSCIISLCKPLTIRFNCFLTIYIYIYIYIFIYIDNLWAKLSVEAAKCLALTLVIRVLRGFILWYKHKCVGLLKRRIYVFLVIRVWRGFILWYKQRWVGLSKRRIYVFF